jgi:hypothetical protein
MATKRKKKRKPTSNIKKINRKNKSDRSGKKPQDLPLSTREIEEKLRACFESVISFCLSNEKSILFLGLEKELQEKVRTLGCLICQLFLAARHEQFDYAQWLESGRYYPSTDPVGRTINTVFGEVRFWRTYFVRKEKGSGGFYPFDSVMGIPRDSFSPCVMGLASRLATRVSFQTSVLLFSAFYGWSPSKDSIQNMVLGIGRDAGAYMEVVDSPKNDGEILIIEVDGKAIATATPEELEKRLKSLRKNKGKTSCCKRHERKGKKNKRKKKKKGDKSKNGRSATLVAMYTLRIDENGNLLHGPVNKKVWGSYAPRKVMLDWARRQATKRGFPPDTTKRIHIAIDGEKCLKDGLTERFPNATFALDVRHAEEYLWKVASAYYPSDSEERGDLADVLIGKLYEGEAEELVELMREMKESLSKRAKRDKAAREILGKTIQYMEKRLTMMNYKKYMEEDVPIATGVIEGAVRNVIGERQDCSGMRWVPGKAEAVLHLRCIELNGDWDHFYEWAYSRRVEQMQKDKAVLVRSKEPLELPMAA